MTEQRPLTVGTAGHVDHGKTALVAALTGVETDRLEEERRRGISIELGFAELEAGGHRLSLVDVPGHERFVRTMIAGAGGIDLFLLVVAADEGPMPQTEEHLTVLRALAVRDGVVALNRCDLAEQGQRDAAAAACARLVPQLPVVAVSARSGAGVEELRAELGRAAARVAERPPPGRAGEPLLHVDRAFSIAGHGTVVTGTLRSGELRREQELLLLPSGRTARVRGLEVHGRGRERVLAGGRVAVNLRGLGRGEVRRGDVLTVAGGAASASYRLDVELGEGSAAIRAERRVGVHLGTAEAAARLVECGGDEVQLRLERPLIARRGDRVVIRRLAPPYTLGGGRILDPAPRRRGRGRPPVLSAPPPAPDPPPAPPPAPAAPGALARRLLDLLREDGLRPRTPALLAADAGVERRAVERALRELVAAGAAVRAKPDVVYPAERFAELRRRALALVEREGSTSVAELRDELGLSRKYAQALLERLDGDKDLRRAGDRHLPRREPVGG